jgi:hypothetical protein
MPAGLWSGSRNSSIFNLMAEENDYVTESKPEESGSSAKKRYQDPDFQYERVFETMALSCGKVHPTNFQCTFHRNAS